MTSGVGVPLVLAMYKRVNYKRSTVTWRNFYEKSPSLFGRLSKKGGGNDYQGSEVMNILQK
jgi:hypothetical protein